MLRLSLLKYTLTCEANHCANARRNADAITVQMCTENLRQTLCKCAPKCWCDRCANMHRTAEVSLCKCAPKCWWNSLLNSCLTHASNADQYQRKSQAILDKNGSPVTELETGIEEEITGKMEETKSIRERVELRRSSARWVTIDIKGACTSLKLHGDGLHQLGLALQEFAQELLWQRCGSACRRVSRPAMPLGCSQRAPYHERHFSLSLSEWGMTELMNSTRLRS